MCQILGLNRTIWPETGQYRIWILSGVRYPAKNLGAGLSGVRYPGKFEGPDYLVSGIRDKIWFRLVHYFLYLHKNMPMTKILPT